MPSIVRLEGLALGAKTYDILEFFQGFQISEGDISISDNGYGDAFITFHVDDDARKALQKDGGLICNHRVNLFKSSVVEMQNEMGYTRCKLPKIHQNRESQEYNSATAENQRPQRRSSPNYFTNHSLGQNREQFTRNYSTEIVSRQHDTAYFLIKCDGYKNISLAKRKDVWSSSSTEKKNMLNEAFIKYRSVILIFSVTQSGAFQGYARMTSESYPDSQGVGWIIPSGKNNNIFSDIFNIQWINCNTLPSYKTSNLLNEYDGFNPVRRGFDCQRIEPGCAQELCNLFPLESSTNIPLEIQHNKKRYLSPTRSSSASSHDKRQRLNDYNHFSTTSENYDHHRSYATPSHIYD